MSAVFHFSYRVWYRYFSTSHPGHLKACRCSMSVRSQLAQHRLSLELGAGRFLFPFSLFNNPNSCILAIKHNTSDIQISYHKLPQERTWIWKPKKKKKKEIEALRAISTTTRLAVFILFCLISFPRPRPRERKKEEGEERHSHDCSPRRHQHV